MAPVCPVPPPTPCQGASDTPLDSLRSSPVVGRQARLDLEQLREPLQRHVTILHTHSQGPRRDSRRPRV